MKQIEIPDESITAQLIVQKMTTIDCLQQV